MILTQQDSELFFKLYNALLDYTNEIKRVVTMKAEYSDNERVEIRDILFKDVSIIDKYVKNNPDSLSTEEIEIIQGWKQFIFDSFILLRQLSQHAIFLHDDKAYGVVALTRKFDYMVYSFPAYITTVLLPFKDKIIYDGLMLTRPIGFGGGMKKSFNRTYNEAKTKYGIVTSFEASASVENENDKDLKMMQFYLKSQANYYEYFDEICDLMYKNDQLETAYYQGAGRLFAKTRRKKLKEIGITNAFFAIYEDTIVGSAKTKQELEKIMNTVFPSKKLRHLYYFQVK